MLSSLRLAAVALLAAVAGVQALPQATDGGSSNSTGACNNSPTLCDRQYNEITHLGAHNSAFLRDASTDNSMAGNQFKNATIALDAGLRLLQAQVHLENGNLRLCHSSCGLLDAGLLQDWLSSINYWMGQNPNEVVTLLIVNSDDRPASEYATVFQGSGISQYGFEQTTAGPTADWPTLQSMIDSGKRLVTFLTNADADAQYPYLLPEFSYVFETHFEVTSIDGFNCTLDRPTDIGGLSSALSGNYLSLVNHFKYQQVIGSLLIPDTATLDVVNSPDTDTEGNLGLHLQSCQTQWSKKPNFVLLDFWSRGDPIAAVDRSNSLSDITGRKTDNGDDSAASSNLRNLGRGAILAFLAGALLLF